LGLSVSNEIIKKHGGMLRVRSKVGEGSTFTVMLPEITENVLEEMTC
jgi:signal transduction histidine kinase